MLASLLPGLRDLRTPLACGITWLLSAFFLFHDSLPAKADATGIASSLYQLHDLIGSAALGALTIALAYIIGVLTRIDLHERVIFASSGDSIRTRGTYSH